MSDSNEKEVFFRPPAKLLVVDDSHLNRSFILNAFILPNYEVEAAVDALEGIEMAEELQPELILLDIMMPGMDGFEAADKLRENPATRDIPIIFITALDAIQDKLKAFEAGAVDFVTKPFNHKELMARVRTHVELRRAVDQKENMFRIAMEEKRNAAIARISAGVSHNFNNMLGVSFGNIMLVESLLGQDVNPMALESLNDVRKSLERMQSLVKKFLLLAHRSSEVEGGKPVPTVFNLKELADEVINNLVSQKSHASPPQKVYCANKIDPNVKIYCDYSHFRELLHLIINEAVETTNGKSETVITSENIMDGEIVLCKLKVKGLPLEGGVEESIFEPFALPIANVGAGLSFSVAKHLIELNNGSVSATFPEEDTILFTLKIASDKSAPADALGEQEE
jgi:CheY-like chemotaxis protein